MKVGVTGLKPRGGRAAPLPGAPGEIPGMAFASFWRLPAFLAWGPLSSSKPLDVSPS